MNWNATVGLGKATECCAVRCAICGKTAIYPASESGPAERAPRDGWIRASQLRSGGKRPWICSVHHEPGRPGLYIDRESDRRDPRDAFSDLPSGREAREEGRPEKPDSGEGPHK